MRFDRFEDIISDEIRDARMKGNAQITTTTEESIDGSFSKKTIDFKYINGNFLNKLKQETESELVDEIKSFFDTNALNSFFKKDEVQTQAEIAEITW